LKPKTKLILSTIILTGLFVSSFASAALVQCGQTDSNTCTIQDLISEIFIVINFLLGSATLLAIGYILYGGVRMIMAYGNEESVKNARSTITNAIVGLVIILISFLIVTSVTAYLTGYSINDLRTKFFQF
jgi:amino acid transporter